MTDFFEGDLVEAVLGETRIVARLESWSDGNLFFKGWGSGVNSAKYAGYTLTLVERAVPKVELPTEPGHYQDADGRHWLHQIYGGSAYGAPYRDVDRWVNFNGNIVDDPESSAPFTRLEPVADTARRVLDAVRSRMTMWPDGKRPNGTFQIISCDLESVAIEFGVTDVV